MKNKEIEEMQAELQKLKDQRKKQLDRQNAYITENYKRITVSIKKELYQEIKNKYPELSINGYITKLIQEDISKH